jgi:hypothetical protein
MTAAPPGPAAPPRPSRPPDVQIPQVSGQGRDRDVGDVILLSSYDQSRATTIARNFRSVLSEEMHMLLSKYTIGKDNSEAILNHAKELLASALRKFPALCHSSTDDSHSKFRDDILQYLHAPADDIFALASGFRSEYEIMPRSFPDNFRIYVYPVGERDRRLVNYNEWYTSTTKPMPIVSRASKTGPEKRKGGDTDVEPPPKRKPVEVPVETPPKRGPTVDVEPPPKRPKPTPPQTDIPSWFAGSYVTNIIVPCGVSDGQDGGFLGSTSTVMVFRLCVFDPKTLNERWNGSDRKQFDLLEFRYEGSGRREKLGRLNEYTIDNAANKKDSVAKFIQSAQFVVVPTEGKGVMPKSNASVGDAGDSSRWIERNDPWYLVELIYIDSRGCGPSLITPSSVSRTLHRLESTQKSREMLVNMIRKQTDLRIRVQDRLSDNGQASDMIASMNAESILLGAGKTDADFVASDPVTPEQWIVDNAEFLYDKDPHYDRARFVIRTGLIEKIEDRVRDHIKRFVPSEGPPLNFVYQAMHDPFFVATTKPYIRLNYGHPANPKPVTMAAGMHPSMICQYVPITILQPEGPDRQLTLDNVLLDHLAFQFRDLMMLAEKSPSEEMYLELFPDEILVETAVLNQEDVTFTVTLVVGGVCNTLAKPTSTTTETQLIGLTPDKIRTFVRTSGFRVTFDVSSQRVTSDGRISEVYIKAGSTASIVTAGPIQSPKNVMQLSAQPENLGLPDPDPSIPSMLETVLGNVVACAKTSVERGSSRMDLYTSAFTGREQAVRILSVLLEETWKKCIPTASASVAGISIAIPPVMVSSITYYPNSIVATWIDGNDAGGILSEIEEMLKSGKDFQTWKAYGELDKEWASQSPHRVIRCSVNKLEGVRVNGGDKEGITVRIYTLCVLHSTTIPRSTAEGRKSELVQRTTLRPFPLFCDTREIGSGNFLAKEATRQVTKANKQSRFTWAEWLGSKKNKVFGNDVQTLQNVHAILSMTEELNDGTIERAKTILTQEEGGGLVNADFVEFVRYVIKALTTTDIRTNEALTTLFKNLLMACVKPRNVAPPTIDASFEISVNRAMAIDLLFFVPISVVTMLVRTAIRKDEKNALLAGLPGRIIQVRRDLLKMWFSLLNPESSAQMQGLSILRNSYAHPAPFFRVSVKDPELRRTVRVICEVLQAQTYGNDASPPSCVAANDALREQFDKRSKTPGRHEASDWRYFTGITDDRLFRTFELRLHPIEMGRTRYELQWTNEVLFENLLSALEYTDTRTGHAEKSKLKLLQVAIRQQVDVFEAISVALTPDPDEPEDVVSDLAATRGDLDLYIKSRRHVDVALKILSPWLDRLFEYVSKMGRFGASADPKDIRMQKMLPLMIELFTRRVKTLGAKETFAKEITRATELNAELMTRNRYPEFVYREFCANQNLTKVLTKIMSYYPFEALYATHVLASIPSPVWDMTDELKIRKSERGWVDLTGIATNRETELAIKSGDEKDMHPIWTMCTQILAERGEQFLPKTRSSRQGSGSSTQYTDPSKLAASISNLNFEMKWVSFITQAGDAMDVMGDLNCCPIQSGRTVKDGIQRMIDSQCYLLGRQFGNCWQVTVSPVELFMCTLFGANVEKEYRPTLIRRQKIASFEMFERTTKLQVDASFEPADVFEPSVFASWDAERRRLRERAQMVLAEERESDAEFRALQDRYYVLTGQIVKDLDSAAIKAKIQTEEDRLLPERIAAAKEAQRKQLDEESAAFSTGVNVEQVIARQGVVDPSGPSPAVRKAEEAETLEKIYRRVDTRVKINRTLDILEKSIARSNLEPQTLNAKVAQIVELHGQIQRNLDRQKRAAGGVADLFQAPNRIEAPSVAIAAPVPPVVQPGVVRPEQGGELFGGSLVTPSDLQGYREKSATPMGEWERPHERLGRSPSDEVPGSPNVEHVDLVWEEIMNLPSIFPKTSTPNPLNTSALRAFADMCELVDEFSCPAKIDEHQACATLAIDTHPPLSCSSLVEFVDDFSC